MYKTGASYWVVWGVLLAAFIAVAVLCAPAFTACYFTAVLATLLVFALAAGMLVKASRVENAVSAAVGQPITQVAVGMLVLQMIAGIAFVLFAASCHWLIAAVVECVLLCIAAAALTIREESTAENADEPEEARKDGSAE